MHIIEYAHYWMHIIEYAIVIEDAICYAPPPTVAQWVNKCGSYLRVYVILD